jgi:hypothetical protein
MQKITFYNDDLETAHWLNICPFKRVMYKPTLQKILISVFAGCDTNRFFFIVRDNTVVCLSEYSDEIKSGTYKIRVQADEYIRLVV